MTSTAERSVSSSNTGRKEIIAEFEPSQLAAPFVLRCGALCIDYILLISLPVITLMISVVFGSPSSSASGGISNSTGWILGALLFITNFFILPAVNGQTIGKMLTGIRIVRINGTSVSIGTILLRDILGYLLTAVTGGLGFLIAAFGSRGRALHDYIAGTVVIYGNRRLK